MEGEQNIALPGYVSFNHEHRGRLFLFFPDKKHRGPSREAMMSLGVMCARSAGFWSGAQWLLSEEKGG